MEHVTDLSYSTLMKRAYCLHENSCIFHCSFHYNDDQQIEQTLFFDTTQKLSTLSTESSYSKHSTCITH